MRDLDSYFIVNAKENSEVTNSTIANENVNSNSTISSDINKSLSNENTPDKIHADNIEKKKKKKKSIGNFAPANEKLSSSSSIISGNSPTISRNVRLISCTDFNVNGNTTKNSAEILDDVGPPLSHNTSTRILLKKWSIKH